VSSAGNAHIILFDGMCNLCSASVQFVLKRDSKELFQFCSLQSDTGKQLLEQYGLQNYGLTSQGLQNQRLQNQSTQNNELQNKDSASMILLEQQKALTKSSAALTVAKNLDWPWPLLYGFIIVPKFLRDAVYDFIGNRRYRLFGKKESCWIPRQTVQHRFLDNANSRNNPIEVDNER